LETHIWHAKRMKMVNLFGWRLAFKDNEKNSLRIYKSANRSCIIHDASYYTCIELSGDYFQIINCLKPFTNKKMHPLSSFRDRQRQGRQLLFGSDGILICPLRFLWITETSIFILRHRIWLLIFLKLLGM
jgi:ribonuclease P/MRP protein subunit POP1